MSFPWANHYEPKNPFMQWVDQRLPLPRLVYSAVGAGYPVPRNLNYFWNFGVLSGLALVIQIVTGVVLAMHFAANSAIAFNSVEHIMRDVNSGWMLRYAHANGEHVLHRGLSPHLPWSFLRIVQGAARNGVAARPRYFPFDDGDRLHGLCAALGTDELLGCKGDYWPVRCDPAGRPDDPDLASGRLCA